MTRPSPSQNDEIFVSLKRQLEEEVKALESELGKINAESNTLKKQFQEEEKKLVLEKLDTHFETKKCALMKTMQEESGKTLSESRNRLDQKHEQAEKLVKKLQIEASEAQANFVRSFQVLARITIPKENHYGNMEEFSSGIFKETESTMNEITLTKESISRKKLECNELEQKLRQVDSLDITPSLKKDVLESSLESMKIFRKKLLAIKMENHGLKLKG